MTLLDYLFTQGITRTEFADTLGVSRSAVTRWINGERTPKGPVIRKIRTVTHGKVKPTDFAAETAKVASRAEAERRSAEVERRIAAKAERTREAEEQQAAEKLVRDVLEKTFNQKFDGSAVRRIAKRVRASLPPRTGSS